MKKFLFIILLIILIIEICFIVFGLTVPWQKVYQREENIQTVSLKGFEPGLNKEKFEDSKITVLAVGDIMLDRGVEYIIKTKGEGDYKFPFLRIAQDLEKADILFGNLEGPISDKGERVGSQYSFRAEPESIEGLTFAGFDVLSLANNHLLDYGREALESTMRILNRNKIIFVGAGFEEKEAFSVKIKEIKGTKIGFLAFTNLGPEIWKASQENSGIAWFSERDIEKVKQDIKKTKEKVNVLIVSFHSGEEYTEEPTPSQIYFARSFIESGADLVLGHHPHVIQRIEKYQSGWIAYSLGNFVFDQGFSQETMEGLMLEIIIENKKIKELNPQKIKISELFQPYLVKEEDKVIQKESLKDLNQIKANFISQELSFFGGKSF
ncbi:MAG: CapA family protein [Patescibacteria group bacterium]|nr:CapA family protein [Patescibacteria group bacterium]